MIWGEITEETARYAVTALEYLYHNSKKQITILINSDGGCVDSAYAIIDWMNLLKSEDIIIRTIATKACSAATDILAFGTPGYRYATPNAIIMIHDATLEFNPNSPQQHQRQLDFDKQRLMIMNKQMAKICGKSLPKYMKDMATEKWFMPEEALKYKIIDEILTEGTQHE